MLHKQSLTYFFYEYGYNGIDNIYEYWNDHKLAILKSYESRYSLLEGELKVFDQKVRWASNLGIFFAT